MTAATGPPLPPAGWYEGPDPAGGQRYWDGKQWTDRRQEAQDTKDDDRPKQPDILTALGTLAGLLTGAATLVYVAGGAVLRLRLQNEGLPDDLGVVANLPRELLIGTGLVDVVVPLLLVIGGAAGIAYAIALTRWVSNPLGIITDLEEEDVPRRSRRWLAWFGVAVVVALPLVSYRLSPPVGAFVGSVVSVVVLLIGARLIAKSYAQTGRTLWAGVLSVLVVAATLGPWAVIFAEQREALPRATVCAIEGWHKDGSLIGESGDRVYIGEDPVEDTDPARVASVPLSQVQQVYIGGTGGCAPSPDQPSPRSTPGGKDPEREHDDRGDH